MRGARAICVVLAITVLLGRSAVARWESGQDSKTRSELEQLDERQLFEEAFDVCARRASLLRAGRGPATEAVIDAAEDYLTVIESVARTKWGTVPGWLRELSFARSTQDCQRVFRAFVSGDVPPETKPAPAGSLRFGGGPQTPTPGADSTPRGLGETPGAPRAGQTTSLPKRTPVIRVPGFPLAWHTPTAAPVPSPRRAAPGASRKHEGQTGHPRPVASPRPVATAAPTVPSKPPPGDEISDELPPWFR